MLLLLAAITFTSSYEGGALGRVERAGPDHYRCSVPGQSDQDNRNRQASWYNFRVDGAAGKRLTIDLVELLGEYNYRAGTHAVTAKTRPVVSTDGAHWTHLPDSAVEWVSSGPALRLKLDVKTPRLWIAHQEPYTNTRLAALAREFAAHKSLKVDTIGRSVEKRPLFLWTIHDAHAGSATAPAVWLMFRQHSWESGSSLAGEGVVRWLLGATTEANEARRRFVWKILPAADPDGLAHGGVRFNRNGYDLNRNWDLVQPDKMPEIAAQKQAIFQWLDAGRKIALFLSIHNTETSEYLEGPPADFGQRWFALLREGTTFHPSRPDYTVMTATTTEGKPGRMNVAQALWRERKIPAFLMEQRVEFNEKLGRYPVAEDRLRFGAGLAQSIVKLFAGER